ncbi:MAG TPA: hypothetical protein VEW28_01655 [Candidatus Kapabacteria bacterium]|nr:hypothetical protein [Candidatus Kapabacteria bacterium]
MSVFVVAALAAILFIELCVCSSSAFAKKKPKKKKNGTTISIEPGVNFKPSVSFAPGTVGNYFFPDRRGASWTLVTVQTLVNDSGRVLRRDTAIHRETVVDTARFSLQRLPLMATRDYGFRPGSKDTIKSESFYYVDDSVAMTIFNNSVTARQNYTFLVSPLVIGNAWHDQYDDSVQTVIAGYVDSVKAPVGTFDSVIVTVTARGATDLRKYFARGFGIVKSIYRSTGPGGHGIIIVTTEMTECIRPDEKKEVVIKKEN